MLVTNQKIL